MLARLRLVKYRANRVLIKVIYVDCKIYIGDFFYGKIIHMFKRNIKMHKITLYNYNVFTKQSKSVKSVMEFELI